MCTKIRGGTMLDHPNHPPFPSLYSHHPSSFLIVALLLRNTLMPVSNMCSEPAAHANKQCLTEALINMQNTHTHTQTVVIRLGLQINRLYLFFVPNDKTTH